MQEQAQSFTILGCSSGDPQPGRGTSSYLLTIGDSLSIIDCGSGSVPTFLKYNFDPRRIERIFITHTHSDHIADLTLYIQMIHLTRRKNKLTIYLPNEFVNVFSNYLYAVYLLPERLSFELEIIGYEADFEYDGDFNLSAYGNSHHGKVKQAVRELGLPNLLHSCSFSISMPNSGKSLFYSGDLGTFEDVRAYLDGHTYAVIESTHVGIDELIEFAKSSDVEKFVVTHLGSEKEIADIDWKIADNGLNNMVTAKEGMTLAL